MADDVVTEPPALAHIEKMLADSYRKEIDQEENIWRSLPFFAATLALQLTALFQMIERLPRAGPFGGVVSASLVGTSLLFSLIALAVLLASVYPARFKYLAGDAALLDYTRGLIADEATPANRQQAVPVSALITLKETLATQYAGATDNNRRINKRRERLRSIAGLLMLVSLIFTLALVTDVFATYVLRADAKEQVDGQQSPPAPDPARAGAATRVAPAPADAGSDQGVVHNAGGADTRASGKAQP